MAALSADAPAAMAGCRNVKESAMRLFVVCTRGCTASKWLARSLEQLADVECSHGTASLTRYDAEYQHGELIETIHREWFERQSTPLAVYLDSQVRDRGRRYSGNVHRYQLARHVEMIRAAPDVQVANIIRHPVTWQDSRTALFVDLLGFVPHIGQQLYYTLVSNFDFLWPFVQRHGIAPVDPEFMAFVGNLVALPELAKDAHVSGYPSFRMEDVCVDAEAFNRLLVHISGGARKLGVDEAERIFGNRQIHQHRAGSGKDAAATFAAWPEWKRELFVPMLIQCQLPSLYAQWGYDFTFLQQAQAYAALEQRLKPNLPGGPFWISTDV